MAYYITGFYSEKNAESGYYVFNSELKKAIKISNSTMKSNANIINGIIGVRLGSKVSMRQQILVAKRMGKTSYVYKPAISIDGIIQEDIKTLVYIDYNNKKLGLVNYDGSLIEWISFRDVDGIDINSSYNNIGYTRNNWVLSREYYHIIGDNIEDIYLKIENETTTIESEDYNNLVDAEEDVKETLTEILNKSKNYNTKLIELTQKRFYETMLAIMKDDDTVTLPKWVLKTLNFRLKYNLDKSMNLDKMVSLGEITLSEYSNVSLIVLIKMEDSLDTIRIQVVKSLDFDKDKNYDIEAIREDYRQWKANKKNLII